MKKPLLAAMENHLGKGLSSFHTPGHKGAALGVLSPVTPYDLTEIRGLDSLYHSDGVIAEIEEGYRKLYGTKASFLSAGGSTLAVQAMLSLVAAPGKKIIAGRVIHTSAVNTMALCDLDPIWIYPQTSPQTGLSQGTSPCDIERAIIANPDAVAVYITSPTYWGAMSDISAISAITKAHNIPLVVDNAQGAHLKFLPSSLHPCDLGADLCCDSLHKTLPTLTGAALLHIQNAKYLAKAKQMMALYGSTSPNYLIMLSAELALSELKGTLPQRLIEIASQMAMIKQAAVQNGYSLPLEGEDPFRLTLRYPLTGQSYTDFSLLLEANNIEPEYLDENLAVFLAGGGNSNADLNRLLSLVTAPIAAFNPSRLFDNKNHPADFCLPHARKVLSLREALFAPSASVDVDYAEGRVSAGMIAPCPPGISLINPGEFIDAQLCFLLKKLGIFKINVVQ